MAIRECEECGHSMRMLQFKNENRKRLTCPDCGWRKSSRPLRKEMPPHTYCLKCGNPEFHLQSDSTGKGYRCCTECGWKYHHTASLESTLSSITDRTFCKAAVRPGYDGQKDEVVVHVGYGSKVHDHVTTVMVMTPNTAWELAEQLNRMAWLVTQMRSKGNEKLAD